MMSSASIAICYKSVQPCSHSYKFLRLRALIMLEFPMDNLELALYSLDIRDLEENPTMM